MTAVATDLGIGASDVVRTPASRRWPLASADTLVVWNVFDENGNTLSVSRQARPDSLGIGVETTLMTYDNANRRETVSEYGRVTTTEYDAAGNVVRSISPRNKAIRMLYDAAGRLRRRATSLSTRTMA